MTGVQTCALPISDSRPANGLFDALGASLQAEFQPISDMRASSAYRRELLGALMDRYTREFASSWRSEKLVSLESWESLDEVLA